MGKKDLAEKKLEDYNDVFADIFNTLLFGEKELDLKGLKTGPLNPFIRYPVRK